MPTGRYAFAAVTVNGTVYAIGGLINRPKDYKDGHITTTTNVNEAYNTANDTWVEKNPMPSPHWLDSFGIAVCQSKIYCIGGPANNVYDPSTDTWEAKTPMPTSRQHLTANVVNDKIYLIGGLALGPPPAWQDKLTNDPRMKYITYSYSNVTEVYDPTTDSWTEKAPIPNAVISYASAVVDNKIFVISGGVPNASGKTTDLVQVYDPETDKWSQAAPIPYPVQNAAAGVITNAERSAIYVIGGSSSPYQSNGSTLNQIYFPENNSWTTGAPMIANRYVLSLAVADDKLYAIGGLGDQGYTATTYQYTPGELTQSPSPETQNIPTLPLGLIIATAVATIAISIAAIRLKKKTQKQREAPKTSSNDNQAPKQGTTRQPHN